jgi:hypothetical protein
VWRVACGVWRVACGVWRVACGVWRVACGCHSLHSASCVFVHTLITEGAGCRVPGTASCISPSVPVVVVRACVRGVLLCVQPLATRPRHLPQTKVRCRAYWMPSVCAGVCVSGLVLLGLAGCVPEPVRICVYVRVAVCAYACAAAGACACGCVCLCMHPFVYVCMYGCVLIRRCRGGCRWRQWRR